MESAAWLCTVLGIMYVLSKGLHKFAEDWCPEKACKFFRKMDKVFSVLIILPAALWAVFLRG